MNASDHSQADPDKFGVVVSYNGVNKGEPVERNELLQSVLERALALFHNPAGQALGLYSAAGVELANLSQTVHQAGIGPGDKLLLRPRSVQGG